MSKVELYVIGSLCVSSMMMWWFTTNLPIHIVQLLYMFGYRKNDNKFWKSDTPIHLWTQADLNEWKLNSLPAWLDELSSCPGCLSMHFSFWTSALIAVLTWTGYESVVLFLLAWLSWPYIANFNLALLKRLNKH